MDEFREWLSDNLRYIALILGVLIVLGGAFLGVRAVTKSGSTPNTETATDSMDNSTGGLVTSGSAKPSGTAAGSLKDTAALVTEDGQLTEEAQNGIKTVVKSYYDALNARNVEAVKKVTDTLSAEDIASIESSKTAYSGVSVIPKVGPTTDGRSAVAFVDYKYQNPDQAILHSGLSWLYLQFDENEGAYKIKVDAADDAAVKTYAQSLTADPEIASVMQRVQVEADAAAAADQGVSQAAAEPAAESGETESAVTEGQPEADAAQSEGQADVEATDGQAEADNAVNVSQKLFAGDFKGLSVKDIKSGMKSVPSFDFAEELPLIDVLVNNKIASSKREAREFISGNAISVNGEVINDPAKVITKDMAIEGEILIFRRGKKKYFIGMI